MKLALMVSGIAALVCAVLTFVAYRWTYTQRDNFLSAIVPLATFAAALGFAIAWIVLAAITVFA